VIDPLFWLGLSILFVATSLTAVLVAAIPALQELARAARSAEKFFDTLSRELPPTLNAIRNTSLEITDLTDDVSEGVKSASQVVKQFDQSLDSAKKQAENIQISTRSVLVGFKAAWKSFTRKKPVRRNPERLPNNDKPSLTLRERESKRHEG
jgi:ABC-type transporter Mla subunit MlaD